MIRAAIALFGAGIASFLAPCILPLVPAYLGLIVGSASAPASEPVTVHPPVASDDDRDRRDRVDLVRATLIFIAGFTAVFVVFGTFAGALGRALDRVRGAVQLVGGIAVLIFGLALIGIVRGPLWRTVRLPLRLPSGALARPAVVGATFGAAWTPCVGPLLGAALVAATRAGGAGRGALLLAAYSLGLGLPFLAIALGLVSIPAVRAAGRRWGPGLSRVGGVLLVALGVLLVSGRYGALVSALARIRN